MEFVKNSNKKHTVVIPIYTQPEMPVNRIRQCKSSTQAVDKYVKNKRMTGKKLFIHRLECVQQLIQWLRARDEIPLKHIALQRFQNDLLLAGFNALCNDFGA